MWNFQIYLHTGCITPLLKSRDTGRVSSQLCHGWFLGCWRISSRHFYKYRTSSETLLFVSFASCLSNNALALRDTDNELVSRRCWSCCCGWLDTRSTPPSWLADAFFFAVPKFRKISPEPKKGTLFDSVKIHILCENSHEPIKQFEKNALVSLDRTACVESGKALPTYTNLLNDWTGNLL